MKKLKKIEAACVLCALWYVSGIDEETILRICKSYGFKEGEGMQDQDWKSACRHLDIDIRGVSIETCTLRKFIKNHPTGLYLLGTFDHLFVVDNSIIVDPRCENPPGMGRLIKQAWLVIKDK